MSSERPPTAGPARDHWPLAAVPLALLLFAVTEAGAGPFASYTREPWAFLEISAHLVALVFQSLAGAVGYCVVVAGLELYLARPAQSARFGSLRSRLLIHALPALLLSAYAYRTLVLYEEFLAHPLLVLPYVVFFVVLLLLAAALGWAPRSLPLARWRWLAAAACALIFTAVHVTNHSILPGRYFTVHLSLFQLGLPVLFLGCAHALAARTGPAPARSRRLTKLALACGALCVVSLLAERTVLAAERDTVLTYTLLGEAQVVYHPFDAETEGHGSAVADPHGVDRFLKASLMPQLPSDFELDDYNVLLIVSEALRFDRTSLADESLRTTPNLRRLARDGAYWFSRAHSPSSATLPSNASLLGLSYPHATHLQTWAKSWCGELKQEQETAAELLSDAGYATFRVSHNFHRGFSRSLLGLGQGFAEQELIDESTSERDLTLDRRIAERAQKSLQANAGRRFFGWVFFASPHAPYYSRYDDMPRKSAAERYLHELRYMDEQLGVLLETLRQQQLLEKTILIFTADHGEELGDHRGSGHLTLYDECTHVPLVLRIPGTRGGEIRGTTSTAYVLPWLLLHGSDELRAAARRKATLELGPMLRDTDGAVITELVGHDKMQSALIWDDAKVIYDFNAKKARVFDLLEDPDEQMDVLVTQPDAFPELRERADGYRNVRAAIRKYSIDAKRMPGSGEAAAAN